MFKVSVIRGSFLVAAVALGVVLAGCSSCNPCGSPCDPCQAPCEPCQPCQPACDPCGARLSDPPPEAKAGEAWCRVWIPPTYESVEEKVCTCPASCTREWVEPEYEERTRTVCVCPASCKQIPVPAEYETVSEQVMVCPGRTEWRKVECTAEQLAEGEKQGDCWMLCEVPPVYETRCKQVCTKPASCRTEEIPAQYEEVTERVCVKPGYWKENPVPAQYETRTRQVCSSPGRWEWRRNEACEVPENACPPAAGGNEAPPAGEAGAAMDEMLGSMEG